MADMPIFNKIVENYLTMPNYPYAGLGSTVMLIQRI